MKNPSSVIRPKSAASAAHFLVWAAATEIALQAFTAPSLAQPPLTPHQVTVWTPMPAHQAQPASSNPLRSVQRVGRPSARRRWHPSIRSADASSGSPPIRPWLIHSLSRRLAACLGNDKRRHKLDSAD